MATTMPASDSRKFSQSQLDALGPGLGFTPTSTPRGKMQFTPNAFGGGYESVVPSTAIGETAPSWYTGATPLVTQEQVSGPQGSQTPIPEWQTTLPGGETGFIVPSQWGLGGGEQHLSAAEAEALGGVPLASVMEPGGGALASFLAEHGYLGAPTSPDQSYLFNYNPEGVIPTGLPSGQYQPGFNVGKFNVEAGAEALAVPAAAAAPWAVPEIAGGLGVSPVVAGGLYGGGVGATAGGITGGVKGAALGGLTGGAAGALSSALSTPGVTDSRAALPTIGPEMSVIPQSNPLAETFGVTTGSPAASIMPGTVDPLGFGPAATSAAASDAGMLPTPGNQATGINPATGQPITAAGLPTDPAAAADLLTGQIADLTAFQNATSGFPSLADAGGGFGGGGADIGAFGGFNALAANDLGTATTQIDAPIFDTGTTSDTFNPPTQYPDPYATGNLPVDQTQLPPSQQSPTSFTDPSNYEASPVAKQIAVTNAQPNKPSTGWGDVFNWRNAPALAGLALAGGAALTQRGNAPPGADALNKVSGPAIAQGQQLVAQAAAGTLTASQQAGIDQWVRQQKAQAAQFAFNAYGTNSSTMQQQMNEEIDARAEVMKQQILQNTFNEGFNLLNLGNADQQALAKLQFEGNQQLMTNMQNALAALSRVMGSTNFTQA